MISLPTLFHCAANPRVLLVFLLLSGAPPLWADNANRSQAITIIEQYRAEHGGEIGALRLARRKGARQAAICFSCHGPRGNSDKQNMPSLAGQKPFYLVEQLLNFKGRKRVVKAMSDVADGLSTSSMAALATYFSSVARKGSAFDTRLADQGSVLHQAICQQCHGVDGKMSDPIYARLTGQRTDYVEMTLQRFRQGSPLRESQEMRFISQGLSEEDIRALAAYVASL
jgi:cytochrome c553